jgi:hypothetical protein
MINTSQEAGKKLNLNNSEESKNNKSDKYRKMQNKYLNEKILRSPQKSEASPPQKKTTNFIKSPKSQPKSLKGSQ